MSPHQQKLCHCIGGDTSGRRSPIWVSLILLESYLGVTSKEGILGTSACLGLCGPQGGAAEGRGQRHTPSASPGCHPTRRCPVRGPVGEQQQQQL